MKQIGKLKISFYILSFIFLSPVGLHGLLKREKRGTVFHDALVALFSCKALFDLSIYFEKIPVYYFAVIGYVIFWYVILNFMYRRSYAEI